MSSTNRGMVRHARDFYVTPVATIRDFLEVFRFLEPHFDIAGSTLLDPAAGGDTSNPMPYALVLREYGAHVTTIDIRLDSLAEYKQDYLTMNLQHKYDGLFTNPPFNLCMEYIRKGFTDVRTNGFIGLLVRQNFLGSIKRRDFFKRNMPKWIILHSRRPSFTNGSTDSTDYAHVVWQKGYTPRYSNLIII